MVWFFVASVVLNLLFGGLLIGASVVEEELKTDLECARSEANRLHSQLMASERSHDRFRIALRRLMD